MLEKAADRLMQSDDFHGIGQSEIQTPEDKSILRPMILGRYWQPMTAGGSRLGDSSSSGIPRDPPPPPTLVVYSQKQTLNVWSMENACLLEVFSEEVIS